MIVCISLFFPCLPELLLPLLFLPHTMIQTLPGNGATVSSGASNWSSAKLGHLLSTELLQDIHENFDEMGKAAKVGILFAMLYVRKGDIMRMQSVMNKVSYSPLFKHSFHAGTQNQMHIRQGERETVCVYEYARENKSPWHFFYFFLKDKWNMINKESHCGKYKECHVLRACVYCDWQLLFGLFFIIEQVMKNPLGTFG